MSAEFSHAPVLLNETLELLRWLDPNTRVADFTVGGGGHLKALLNASAKPAYILAVDQDVAALKAAQENLKDFSGIHWLHSNFRDLAKWTDEGFDRIWVDLGVSSHQLDCADRGFSFQKDGPLDMRMNVSAGEPISEWLMHCDEDELCRVLRDYGEDPHAKLVARKWVQNRKPSIQTTKAFVEALGFNLESKDRKGRHPLTRVFQALRIQANDEFGALATLLDFLPKILRPGGRVGVFTFHSLEDREVKWGLKGRLIPINKKVIQATEEEQRWNPRSRSAKLRVYEKGGTDAENEF